MMCMNAQRHARPTTPRVIAARHSEQAHTIILPLPFENLPSNLLRHSIFVRHIDLRYIRDLH
jgi:hypothetical protein